MIRRDRYLVIVRTIYLLPNKRSYEATSSKHLIAQHLKVMSFVVVNRDPERAIARQQAPDNLQPIPHQPQPNRMLQPVVVMGEGAAGVVRGINENAFHLASKLRLQRLERQQVIAKDQAVVEDVVIRNPMLGVVRLLRVFQQDARLQPRSLFLANPGEF